MKLGALRLAEMALVGSMTCAAAAHAADDVVIVYDASGSMWGQIDGTSKIEIARDVLTGLVNDWDKDTNLGLVAYGHRSKGDCTDIETLIAPGPLHKSDFIETVNVIKPVGKTPISAAVQQAAELMSYRDSSSTVVLISDGVETCNADPCALSAELAKQGMNFTAHVVGFDLKEEENANLSCIAENTGGVFVPASNAAELHGALDQVQSAMDLKPVTPEPEPEEPPPPEVTVSGPAQATTGAAFDVSWSKTINPRDMVAIVPTGADEGTRATYLRTEDRTEGSLKAPAEPGLYEIRYILDVSSKTLATAPIEVVEAEVTVSGPPQATTGAGFDVSWSKTIDPRDMVAIVPTGADEGTRATYLRTEDRTEGSLKAPAEPGLYEIRYILDVGSKTLATAPIEVVEAEVTVSGPPQATTGAGFDVSWSKTINPRDMVAIVPTGADEGTRATYLRTEDRTEGSLKAPAEPGLYEIRYILDVGSKTLATASIEVIEPEIGISGPEIVRAETKIDITWSSTINSRDMVAIVSAGADEGTRNIYLRAGDKTKGRLIAPAEPGLYEIRYILDVGRKTLASIPLEVVGADAPLDDGAGLSVPETAGSGETITVTWTGESDSTDQRIALAHKDQPDFSWITVQSVAEEKSIDLTMADEAGLYEVRFLDVSGREVLGRSVVEVK
ncbi:VWA domain-containing protein [Vreelandella alkaliphila]|uniref:VWA domain-containing protein n=1 Tax=Halomonadaceae TaxID=28256 RepID=UPI00186658B1|nr:VWA domain-containing protein [Halomonas sp. FME65]